MSRGKGASCRDGVIRKEHPRGWARQVQFGDKSTFDANRAKAEFSLVRSAPIVLTNRRTGQDTVRVGKTHHDVVLVVAVQQLRERDARLADQRLAVETRFLYHETISP